MEIIAQRRFSDLDPDTQIWVEDGLDTLTEQELPRVTDFFSRIRPLLTPSSINHKGFPYEMYVEGSGALYGLCEGVAFMKRVFLPGDTIEFIWLLDQQGGGGWEDVSGRARFLQQIANENHRPQFLKPLSWGRKLLEKFQDKPQTEVREELLLPGVSSLIIEVSEAEGERLIGEILQTTDRLTEEFALEAVKERGLPLRTIGHFKDLVVSFHEAAALLEEKLTESEVLKYCKSRGFSPQEIEIAISKLKTGENPFYGMLRLVYNPGINLLSLIEGARVEVMQDPNHSQ